MIREKGIYMWKLPEEYKEKEILYRRLILFALGLGLIVVYFSQILSVIGAFVWMIMPFIIGGFLAFCLNTFTRVIKRFGAKVLKIEYNPKQEVWYKLITTLIIVVILCCVIFYVGPSLIGSIEKIASELPGRIQSLISTAYAKSEKYPSIHNWMEENEELLSDVPKLVTSFFSFLSSGAASSDTLGGFKSFITSTFSWIWVLFLSVVFSFIAFFNTTRFVKEGRMIAIAFLPPKAYEKAAFLTRKISRVFSQYLGGTVLECCILATLVSVFGLIFRIPNAVLVGVFCGFCALVPMFGATTGAIICTLVILIDSPAKAITFIIMFICIQQVEGNFIYPNVVGKSVGLPAMYVLVAITIGGSLAGIMGMIISIPVATVIYELITEQAQKRIDSHEIKAELLYDEQQDS